MQNESSHPSDEQLLGLLDEELPASDAELVQKHLEACAECRLRFRSFETATAAYAETQRTESDCDLTAAFHARAALQERLAQVRTSQPVLWRRTLAWGTAVSGLLVLTYLLQSSHRQQPSFIVSTPDASLTPGAIRDVDRQAVCSQQNVKNKAVPVAVRRRVLEEYRIPGADPEGYEIDYLITPALGGADDLQNLWPHSNSATVWNAGVKDELEDRLRDMVCAGSVDLSAAQHQIAGDWIAAYKRYFHTEKPLR